MKLLLPPDQNYDCLRCGKTCRSKVRIQVDPYSRKRIEGSDLGARVAARVGGPAVVDEPDGCAVAARDDGRCAFLRDDGLCSVQADLGVDAKPLGCRQYPLFLRPTPEGLAVGVSFFCAAIQQDHGRPLAAQAEEIAAVMEGVRLRPLGFEPLPVTFEVAMEWPAYLALESFLAERFHVEDPEVALGRALVGLAGLAVAAPSGTVLGQEQVRSALEQAPQAETHPAVAPQEAFLAAALVAFVESPDPAATPTLTRDLLEGRKVRLPLLGWTGTAADLQALAPCPEAPAQGLRYLRALLHRKFPAQDRPLLDNLALLRLVPRLLRFYTAVSCASRGAAQPEREDVFRAFDVLELDMVSHAKGLDRLYAAFGSFYLSLG